MPKKDLSKVDTHYTSPVVWPLLAIFFSISVYVFSGADKKDTGAEKGIIIYIYIYIYIYIATAKGTVVSILMSSSRGTKLASLSNHDDDSYTNPTNLHI